ncbi:hypothetical protein FPQ18DRAFT_323384 [Pyronema domesticum]|uniref:Similar to Increased recombination centers protein 6 acc. no. C5M2I3 n=1 Tax=Pyronema omphalodes (strain CBS 100304) TaxID=1076935 RepID=U4KY32_PYROM|nr:hypothetical protein FPQ18DRAFT_323384 [Pyronema domesticum]CCX06455.1 Similar to Increased recombination centers protein 6; acc. no. C5M2I3 [Pyronema omphalodes CBS 100304]
MPEEISNPRRILLVGTKKSGKLTVLKALTGSLPITLTTGAPHAGLSHELRLETPYYKATVPIWVDEIPEPAEAPAAAIPTSSLPAATDGSVLNTDEKIPEDETSIYFKTLAAEAKASETYPGTSTETLEAAAAADADAKKTPETAGTPAEEQETLETWTSNYCSPAAKEVLSVLGSIIITFRLPSVASIQSLGKIVKSMGRDWDGVLLAVSLTKPSEAMEDLCQQHGFELIEFDAKGRNEYGETQGMVRVKEALEANDWVGGDGELGGLSDEEEGDEVDGVGLVGDEMQREMLGLRQAITGGDEGEEEDEREVEKLEEVMQRLVMLRDLGPEVSKEQRQRMAKEALRGLMG